MKPVRYYVRLDTDDIDEWVKFLWNTHPSWSIFGDGVVRNWFQAREIADALSRTGD